jgi:hypothetical protein
MKAFSSFLFISVLIVGMCRTSFAQTQPQPQTVWQTINVEHGDYIAGGDGFGYCPQTGSYANETALTGAAAAAIVAKIGLTGGWGALATTFLAQQFQKEIRQSGGTIKEWLEGFGAVESYAACGNVTLAVPPGAQIISIQGYASDGENDWELKACPADTNNRYVCQIGWSEWVWSRDGRVITGIFKNWSGDRERQAKLVVTYLPPSQ